VKIRLPTWERKLLEVAPDANAHRQRREVELGEVELAIFGQPLDALQLPVIHVLGVLANTVIVGEHLAARAKKLLAIGILSIRMLVDG